MVVSPILLIAGMLLFRTLQTVCLAVDSFYDDINAGYAVIAMVCVYHPSVPDPLIAP